MAVTAREFESDTLQRALTLFNQLPRSTQSAMAPVLKKFGVPKGLPGAWDLSNALDKAMQPDPVESAPSNVLPFSFLADQYESLNRSQRFSVPEPQSQPQQRGDTLEAARAARADEKATLLRAPEDQPKSQPAAAREVERLTASESMGRAFQGLKVTVERDELRRMRRLVYSDSSGLPIAVQNVRRTYDGFISETVGGLPDTQPAITQVPQIEPQERDTLAPALAARADEKTTLLRADPPRTEQQAAKETDKTQIAMAISSELQGIDFSFERDAAERVSRILATGSDGRTLGVHTVARDAAGRVSRLIGAPPENAPGQATR